MVIGTSRPLSACSASVRLLNGSKTGPPDGPDVSEPAFLGGWLDAVRPAARDGR